jgi:hypothetical protein
MGTFPVGTGGTGQWNATEAEVNNLALGKDYGGGPIIYTPWTQKEKIYWYRYAKISSINTNRRYMYANIAYW